MTDEPIGLAPGAARHPLTDGEPPDWASEWGQDRFGVFASFVFEGIETRLRWIPPGTWQLGSPKGEVGRYDGEGSEYIGGERQTLVNLPGYWLGEFPCTQDLYEAVIGTNPSRFVDPRRPVETLSWQDAWDMIERLNERVPGLHLHLPTEAEWEVACRAGTESATYAGDLAILGDSNAPVLDTIAWYGGNCGVGFDLHSGEAAGDYEWLRERQYDWQQGGSRQVGLKRPNPWGLHDMLGNVWEWCDDWLGGASVTTLERQEHGGDRVLRGGSWILDARYCRAAARIGAVPGLRIGNFGFRLARGQGPWAGGPQREAGPG